MRGQKKFLSSKKREREGKIAMTEYEARGLVIRNNMARLKAICLAKEEQANRVVGNKR